MGKKNRPKGTVKVSPDELFAQLYEEVEAVAPKDKSVRGRFDGFRIMPDLRAKISRCLELFEDGTQDDELVELLKDTLAHLRNAELYYLRHAVPNRFEPKLEALAAAGVDKDLIDRARKFVRAVHEYVVSHPQHIDLGEAGRLYNQACDGIVEVKDEWQRRIENRKRKMRLVSEEEKERQRAQAEAAREVRLNALRREREAAATGIRERLATL